MSTEQYSKEQEVALLQQGGRDTLPPAYQQAQYPQPQTVQLVPYYGQPPVQGAAGVHRNILPKEMQPNDYLALTIIVAIACGIFNVSSLFFSVPALICSVMAFERRNNGEYSTAKKLGVAAIILNMLAVTWVVVGGVVAVGVLVWWTTYWYD